VNLGQRQAGNASTATLKTFAILRKDNMKQIVLINLENVSDREAAEYEIREAARAIVFDENNLVALLHATKNNYYKLPGGGIEAGETKEIALKRECVEEIGCNIEIINELGSTVEYRKKYQLKQTSFCYVVKVIGEKGEPKLEPDEIEEGFKTIWVSIDDAIKKVNESTPAVYSGSYMVARDTALLEAAQKII
jgi:8-oxo-dGTP diphosphatase